MTKRTGVQLLLALLLVFFAALPAAAQNTAAALAGRVITADGQPVAGAEIVIVHIASGTTARATTGADGRYSARGLRVGGPYKITVNEEGYQSNVQEDVYLLLAETTTVDAQLTAAAPELEAIEVVASGQPSTFSPDNMGSGSNVTRETIEAFPSIKRDLQDYARIDPRISQTDKERGEMSALGQNSRFNSITIDSVSTNDTFGLESNNLPTIRQPISLEAIEEVQVNVVNYDVTQKGYTGANINAVTKSGTNDFDGSLYGTYREKDWVRGKDDRGVTFNRFDTEETYGGTFGGPLIEDTLFFFLNYDKTTLTAPGPDLGSGPFGDGRITQANIDRVVDIARGYGMDPGNLDPSGTDTEVESFLARFDWNINDYHRAALRLSQTEQAEVILPGFGANFFSLSSYWYTQTKQFDNYVAELFSDWSDNFSTEIRLSQRDYQSAPDVVAHAPQVQVDFGAANMRFGTEQFRHQNVLETNTFNAFAAGNWFLGDHDVKFGFDYESNDIYNLFLESNFGQYRFGSADLFEQGVYREYVVRVPTSGNVDDAAADFTLDNLGLFVQDVWTVTPNLTLSLGLRWDEAMVDDEVPYNQAAFNTFHYRNDVTIDGKDLLQPRAGFNYTFDSDLQRQLRGGIGLFQGAAANVWMSNPYTNNGLAIGIFGCGFAGSLQSCPATVPAGNEFSADPDGQPRFGSARADVDMLDPDIEQPSVWKANLAIDQALPWWGLTASAEIILTEVENGIYYQHLNLGAPTHQGMDGRNLYWRNIAPGQYNANSGFFGSSSNARANANQAFREVTLARNTNKGDAQNLSLSLSKPFGESDWFWQISYSFTDATEVNGLTSSRAISNWGGRSIFNPNEEVSSRSAYVTRDRFTGAFSYRHFFFGDYKTEFSMFYEGRKGKPYSWTFQNDMNGDGLVGNDLMYIPAGPGDVLFTDPSEEAQFWEIVDEQGLAHSRGQVVGRNKAFAPWTNQFDIRIAQELPGFFDGNRAEIYLDVLNVGNLLNKDWGHIDEIFFQSAGGQARSFVNFAGIDPASGRYIYDLVNLEQIGRRDNIGESRWALQLGFRYEF